MNYFRSLDDANKKTYAGVYGASTAAGKEHEAAMHEAQAAIDTQKHAAASEAQARIDALDLLEAEQDKAENRRDNMLDYAGSLLTGGGGITGWLNPTGWNKGSSLTVAEAVSGRTAEQKKAEERDALANAQGRTRTERELLRQKALEDARKTEEQEKRVAAMDAAADAAQSREADMRSGMDAAAAVTEEKTLTGKTQKGASSTAFTLYDADEAADAAQSREADMRSGQEESALYRNYTGQAERLSIAQENAAEIGEAEKRA